MIWFSLGYAQQQGEKMNIELHGFLPEHAEEIGERIWVWLEDNLHESVWQKQWVTIVQDHAYDHNRLNEPFLRVFYQGGEDIEVPEQIMREIEMPADIACISIEYILLDRRIKVDLTKKNVKTEADYYPVSGAIGP